MWTQVTGIPEDPSDIPSLLWLLPVPTKETRSTALDAI